VSDPGRLRLFEATGIELEYMIVDRRTLDVMPVCDELLKAASGAYGDAQFGNIGWSNELVLHVVELKTAEPVPSLAGVAGQFQENVARANAMLEPMGAMLLPTAMHPWMGPEREMKLWPHDYGEVYEAFDRIFGCRGHGWANLQSMHINLPFDGDEEFGRLHAAIRVVLPILPALAASSPVVEGRLTGMMDTRLDVYRKNSARIPSVCGRVIPEPLYTRDGYEREILGRIYADMAPLDPGGILRDEFANARGAIARFGRGSIEIRVLDVQECPTADLAIAGAVVGVVRAIAEERIGDLGRIRAWPVDPLADLFLRVIKDADAATVDNAAYLSDLGFRGARCAARELWSHLITAAGLALPGEGTPLGTILARGCLARRIASALRGDLSGERLREVYAELAACLRDGRGFGEGG
jgi:glutamate---cysteine ligase / carboxylate-amine ligase